MQQTDVLRFIADELARPRHQHPKRLTRFGAKAFSQNDEDGIIQEIFSRIGTKTKRFVEFGVESGIQCNTVWLMMQGWQGIWIEGNKTHYESIKERHAKRIAAGHLHVINEYVNPDTVDSLVSSGGLDIDLLSIDTDFYDYWLWESIKSIKPRVVCIEYNANWIPPASITVPKDAPLLHGTNFFGASISALAKLGDRKGYHLVGCSLSGVNAFFVRKDLCEDKFLSPGDAIEHFEPCRYFLAWQQAGHPANPSDVEIV